MDPALLWVISAVLVIVGLAGLALPALPGAPLIFGGLLLAAWAEHFAYVGWGTLTLLGILMLLIVAVDFVAGALGAKKFGASGRSVTGAALGATVGIFFGLPGILLGPFVGAVLGELSARRTLTQAGRAGIGATIGLILGTAAKFALAFSMLGVFAVVRFM
jgi:uncharacterized protein YqgC (DUF456 family)